MAEDKTVVKKEKECGPSSFSIATPVGTFTSTGNYKRNAEFISILSLLCLFVIAYGFYRHDVETSNFRKLQNVQAERLVNSINNTAAAQRFLACIISLPQDQREIEYRNGNGICHRAGRNGISIQ